MDRFLSAGPRLASPALAVCLFLADCMNPAAANAAAGATAQAVIGPAAIGAGSGPAANTIPPAPAPPVGFVVVQTTYLEQMANASKASIDAVSITAQSAILAAKDKEQWMVSIIQILGIFFTGIALVLGYFGMTKYREMSIYMTEIKAASKRAKDASASAETNAAKADKATKDFIQKQLEIATGLAQARTTADELSEKIGEIEQMFAGIHSQKLVMDSLRLSDQKIIDAKAALDDALSLYEIARKLKNERIVSFMAASLALIYMYAEQWKEACEYGMTSIDCNPRHWSDRHYNVACIFALKFKKEGKPEDKTQAIDMLKRYFERKQGEKISAAEIRQALADEDLLVIKNEILAMLEQHQPAAG